MNNYITIENQGENSYSAMKENEYLSPKSCIIKSKHTNPVAGSIESNNKHKDNDLVTKVLILTTSVIGMVLLYYVVSNKILRL